LNYHLLGDSWVFGEMEAQYIQTASLQCHSTRIVNRCTRKYNHWSHLMYNELHHKSDAERVLLQPFNEAELYSKFNHDVVDEFIDFRLFCNAKSFCNLFVENIKQPKDVIYNYGLPGVSNYVQIDSLNSNLQNINAGDTILFFLTTTVRDRFVLTRDHIQMMFDYFYYNIILEKISELHKLNLVIINTFTNPFIYFLHYIKNKKNKSDLESVTQMLQATYKLPYVLAPTHLCNTLVDVLLDQFESNVEYDQTVDFYVNQIREGFNDQQRHTVVHNVNFQPDQYFNFSNKFNNINKQYQSLFQPRNHPTIEGHEKIAKFLTDKYKNDSAFKNMFIKH
jgi:hypothetical protein